MTELAATARLVAIKSTNNGTQKLMNDVLSLIRDVVPSGLQTRLAENWYQLKKQVSAFGLPYEKIDTCRSGCMLYWKEDIDRSQCKFSGLGRYEKKKVTVKVCLLLVYIIFRLFLDCKDCIRLMPLRST